jgi:hypothetical protein
MRCLLVGSNRTRRCGVLLVIMAAALGGCGSEEQEAPLAQIHSASIDEPAVAKAAAATPAPSVEAAELDRRLAVAEKAARKREAARAEKEIDRVRDKADQRLARGNAAIAQHAAVALSEAMRYGTPGVSVSDGGRTLTVSLGRDRGCAGPATGPDSLTERLRSALPFLKEIAVAVEGTPLADHVAARCAFSALPAADTVASANGSGPAETAPFRVGRGHWVVDYGTAGTFLEVLLLQDAEFLDSSARQRGAGVGALEFAGPGTFTLRVAGDGLWSVQVRRASR